MMSRLQPCVIVAALLASVSAAPASAQAPEGKISGVVRDATGAFVPDVTITATNQSTNASQTTKTGTDGSYSLSVAPGTYNVTASLFGFRSVAEVVEIAGGSELPAYDIVNLRAGLRRNRWDVSVYVNNVTDERAFLPLDRERGTRARIAYLTNPPRTFGIATRLNF